MILEPVETDVESLRSLVDLDPAVGIRSSKHFGKGGLAGRGALRQAETYARRASV